MSKWFLLSNSDIRDELRKKNVSVHLKMAKSHYLEGNLRCATGELVNFRQKKAAIASGFFTIWLHDLDSNQGPND